MCNQRIKLIAVQNILLDNTIIQDAWIQLVLRLSFVSALIQIVVSWNVGSDRVFSSAFEYCCCFEEPLTQ